MGRGFGWVALLLCVAGAKGEAPPGYYRIAEGRTGADLRRALHSIISGHRVIPYSDPTRLDTADALADLDEDLISARDWLAQSFKLADDPKRAKLEALEDPDLAPLWREPD